MEIYLMRHGESLANVKNLVCGQMDVPLTLRGQTESKQLKQIFEGKGLSWSIKYSSPLQRAHETGVLATGAKDFLYEDALKEIDTGIWSSKTWEELEVECPPLFNYHLHEDLVFPKGESFNDFFCRVSSWFDQVVIGNQLVKEDCRVLISAHNGSLNVILHHVFGIPKTLFPAFKIRNSSYALIKMDFLKGPSLIQLNIA